MSKTVAESIRGAFDRARGRTALVHYQTITPAGVAVYDVGSTCSVDQSYTVSVKAEQFTCTCQAGDAGKPACWHRAAVALVRACRQGFGMPADGPSAQQLAAEQKLAARRGLERLLSGDVDAAEVELAVARREHARQRLDEIAALFAA